MLTLEVTDLHWIKRTRDDPADLCAHGAVAFSLDACRVNELDGFDCCVSASGLYLLRTLSLSHTPGSPVGERLFPCCGHAMYKVSDSPDVLIVGCPSGVDVSVVREDGTIQLTLPSGSQFRLTESAWQEAVFAFADSVGQFYGSSSPKQPSANDVDGFDAFRAEWESRRGQPLDPRAPAKGGVG